jgi:nitrate reductase assembly molybdenum cofactor insertion protein NarJ
MSWISSILEILKSLFSYLNKKTLTEKEKIARIKREEKHQAWEYAPEFTRDVLKTISDQAAQLELKNINNN